MKCSKPQPMRNMRRGLWATTNESGSLLKSPEGKTREGKLMVWGLVPAAPLRNHHGDISQPHSTFMELTSLCSCF